MIFQISSVTASVRLVVLLLLLPLLLLSLLSLALSLKIVISMHVQCPVKVAQNDYNVVKWLRVFAKFIFTLLFHKTVQQIICHLMASVAVTYWIILAECANKWILKIGQFDESMIKTWWLCDYSVHVCCQLFSKNFWQLLCMTRAVFVSIFTVITSGWSCNCICSEQL